MDPKLVQKIAICCLIVLAFTACSATDEDAARSMKKRYYSSSKCGKLDLVFLLDSSGSVGEANFNKTLDFVKDLINSDLWSAISYGRLQVGVDVFSSSFHREISLDDYSSYYTLKQAVSNITYRGGGTDTATALDSMRTGSFSSYNGHRSGVPKMAVIITDGKANSNSSAVAAAQRAKNAGIYLLAVGVGSSVDYGELSAIASEPASKNVFNATSHSYLYRVRWSLSNRMCSACFGQVDVVFLIDTSTSLSKSVFNATLQMIAYVVDNSDVGSDDMMFGVDTYDAVYRQAISLGQHSSKTSMKRAVESIGYVSGDSTNTALGLVGMKTVSFSSEAGHRLRAAKVGVIVTDGKSTDDSAARTAARSARSAGIQMVAVGVGSFDFVELKAIANNSSYVFNGTSYSTKYALRTLLTKIKSSC